MADWLRAGLCRQEQVIYPHGPLPRDLGGTNVEEAVADGRLVVLEPGDYYPAGRPGSLVRRALADGFPGVRMLGDAQVALEHFSEAEYVHFELEVERLCARGAVSVLCLYGERRTPRRLLLDNLSVHGGGLRAELLSVAPNGGSVRLMGEADAANAELVAAVLAAAGRRRPPDQPLQLDLSALEFCDAAAVRAVLVGTDPLRRRRGTALLVGTPAQVRKTLSILGVDRQPGLLVDGEAAR